jgi:AraC family L-rhamnose operon transcriptional activator RhaR
VRHRFEKTTARKPISLVIDLDLEQSQWPVHLCTHLPETDLKKVRAAAGKLFLMRDERGREMQLMVGSAVFEILHIALKCAGWLRPVNRYGDRRSLPMTRMVERAFERADAGRGAGRDATLAQIAEMTGYQKDHLNRAIRAECGLTLGQLRARLKLQQAQRMLGDPRRSIAQIAVSVGMKDANYFSRWFRKQTGMTPSAWRRSSMKVEPL